MIDREVTLFPEPDSPTRATVSPASISKLTSLTASTVPCRVSNSVFKFETCSTNSLMWRGPPASQVGDNHSWWDNEGHPRPCGPMLERISGR